MSYRSDRFRRTLVAAERRKERAAACREVGLEAQAVEHENAARRLRCWALVRSCMDRQVGR